MRSEPAILQADGSGTILNDDVMPVIEGDIVDANGGPAGDGVVLSNDVTVISQMVLGNIPGPVTVPNQFQRADVNEPCGNGGIDAGDVTIISQYNLGNLPPRAACGVTVPAIVNPIEASIWFGSSNGWFF